MHDPRAIANSIIAIGKERGLFFTNLQLQKLVYIAHGYYLRATGGALSSEPFEAWDFGPVSRSLYSALKGTGDEKVLQEIQGFDPLKRCPAVIREVDEPRATSAIRKAVDIYGQWSAFDLVELTHSFGSPWSRTMKDAQDHANLGMRISDQLILDHFEGYEIDDVEEAL